MTLQPSSMEILNELAFPIHEMLGLPESADLQVERVSGPTTALTLRVTTPGEPGSTYFVKTLKKGTKPGPHLNLGLREVRFYELMETLSPDPYPNIPKCLNYLISGDAGTYYLILQDLSASHQSSESVDFSRLDNWKRPLSALAAFHQCFTGALTADQIAANADRQEDVARYIEKLHRAFLQFRTDHQGVVAESVFSLMERSIPLIRAFELDKSERVFQNRLTTILHRDAHLKNFLYPRTDDGKTVIVDWQFWGLGVGTFDLRHLLGSALNADLRVHQQELVRTYYDAYRDGLDVDYSWEDCWSDYRKGIIDNLFMPVWQYTGFGWTYEQWGKTLDSAVENYYSINCDQLVL